MPLNRNTVKDIFVESAEELVGVRAQIKAFEEQFSPA